MATAESSNDAKSHEPNLRELVKPLFMEMYRHGIKEVRLVRDGAKCQMTMDVDPIPVADDLEDDDYDDDDLDDFDDEGPGDGPLEYLERAAPK